MFWRVFLTIFLIVIGNCFGVYANEYFIKIDQVNDRALIEETFNFKGQEEIKFNVPRDASGFSADFNYSIEEEIMKTFADNGEFSFVSSELIDKIKGEYYFINEIHLPFDTNLSIEMHLQEGFVLGDISVPKPTRIESDGHEIILIWNFDNNAKGESIPLFISFKDPNELSWINYFGIAIVIFLLGAIAREVFKIKKTRKNIEEHLMESEKLVIDTLKKADRQELWQKQLQLATGFSKAKLSRVINNLEVRKLVTKAGFGNTNKIKLV